MWPRSWYSVQVLTVHSESLRVRCQVKLRDEPTSSASSQGISVTMEKRPRGIGPTQERDSVSNTALAQLQKSGQVSGRI